MEKVAANKSHPASRFANDYISAVVNGTLGPQLELKKTLKTLAADGDKAFYNGSLGESIVLVLSPHNVVWKMDKDLGTYQVRKPQHIEVSILFYCNAHLLLRK